jgi:hypothetical protein
VNEGVRTSSARGGVRLIALATVWRGEADMQRSQHKANLQTTRLNMLISREEDEHLGEASREGGRPSPATPCKVAYSVGVSIEFKIPLSLQYSAVESSTLVTICASVLNSDILCSP